MDSLPVPRPAPSPDQPQGMCLDKGYDFDEVRRTLRRSLASPLTSAAGARRPRPSKEKLGSKPGVGWWNARTVKAEPLSGASWCRLG